ncbi:hypothetical protein [Amycolatopsis kentuckyensis]|uniref:hypothetical protein n=1 Tax=Amycolatopsis kentuckyensis TaxID=218823 RepID=UPI000A3A1F35|nr:hypothetical protein [Amycolatopsis kentuckyensis]
MNTAVAWYQRFRKALAGAVAVAAVPGVLGVLNALPGVHIDAGLFATLTAVGAVLVGGGTVAAVPNTPSLDDALKAAGQHGLVVGSVNPAPEP